MSSPQAPRTAGIPRSIWALGMVSLFMDTSSEMIHGLLPVFLVTVLGTSVLAVGVIEGVAEATASVTRVFSGALSDRLGRRKLLAGLGYGLAAATKPLFPLASSAAWVMAARCLDRVGKGIRGAPRDALVADLTPEAIRGASYGLRQSLDTVGAFAGPLLAVLLMSLTGDAIRLVLWVAVVPAFVAVAVLVLGVREPHVPERGSRAPRVRLSDVRHFGGAYWSLLAVASVFCAARPSEAFLVLRAESAGLPLMWVPIVLVVMNVAYAGSAYPAGRLSDRVDRSLVLGAGVALLVASHVVLALAGSIAAVLAGVVLWGLHMGSTQGLLAALVADRAPAALRGTAFGLLHLVSGLAALVASLLAGALWQRAGPAAAFSAGAALAAAALVGLAAARRAASPARGPGRHG